MIKFRKAQKSDSFTNKPPHIIKQIVHYFLSYKLLQEEINASSYGLDYHVPTTNINKNSIVTEFELFFQKLLKDISNIPETEISKVRTKLCNTCEKYCNINVPYAQRKIISYQNSMILSFWSRAKEERWRQWIKLSTQTNA